MCTMNIIAKLINFEQIQPSKNKYSKQNFDTTKINYLKYEKTGSVWVYNRYRVFC